jgi:hypothetical protein
VRRCRHRRDGRGGRRPGRPLGPRLARGAALVALAAGLTCKTSSVSVTLDNTIGLREAATFSEFLLFDGACPKTDDLVDRDYDDPLVDQRGEADAEFDEIGTLDAKRYAFAAVLRNEDCGVLGVGCVEVDLADGDDEVRIPMANVSPPEGSCPGSCEGGLCDD